MSVDGTMRLAKPHRRLRRVFGSLLAAVVLAALGVGLLLIFGREPPSTKGDLVGAGVQLPSPARSLVPTINFSQAQPWPAGKRPIAPAGFHLTAYASGLDHPRWLYVLPNGDVLVAEASTVPRRDRSIAQAVQIWLQRDAGSIKDSANRIMLLRNSGKADAAEQRFVFASNLNQPFGMVLFNGSFYIANTDGVWRFPYRDGDTHLEGPGEKILDLPAGGYNNHWTRNLIANAAGTKLYVTVGSGSNVGENGIDNEFHRANILEFNPDGSGLRVFASGLRNPNGLAFAPGTDTLWTVVNERDMLGNDLVPDYLTSVKDGGFYGWPYSYWGRNIDARVRPQRPDLVATAIPPDYALGSHVAALGLAFYAGDAFPQHFRGGAFIGEHGSWNRRPYSGYKVVFVPFRDGQPQGTPEDFVTGFMPADQQGVAYGRPVGVAIDPTGALLIADDVGNTVWRVAAERRN
jgi:glucose/arabinose dehydrogenase